jgi:hypothetical protein
LVTYSVNKNKYQEYAATFEGMVNSLKAFRREGGINAAGGNTSLFDRTKIPSGMSSDTVFGVQGADDDKKVIAKSGLNALMNDPMIFYGGIGAVGLLVLTILKKRKK